MPTIDVSGIADRQALHAALALELGLPDWYGSNLDALYDCLTDMTEPTQLVIKNFPALAEALGDYAYAFLNVLCDAQIENPRLSVTVQAPEERPRAD